VIEAIAAFRMGPRPDGRPLSSVAGNLMLPLNVPGPSWEKRPERGQHGRLRPQRPYCGAPNSTPSEAEAAAPPAARAVVMIERWLPWIAWTAVLGVFVPPLVSAPSVEMSPPAIPKTPVSVSELIEPPPMTELAGGTGAQMARAANGSDERDPARSTFFEPRATRNEEERPQPLTVVAVPSPPAARDHSLRRPASRHVAFHHRIYRRICCVDPVVDKTGY
jgi:hypothetical protein